MALISLGGIPGAGKNLTGVYLAKRHYKSENNFIKRIIRKRKGLEKIYNNVYSNFPILLDKKNNVWSNEVSIHQLNGEYRFRENAFIEIDEMQISFDSMEYKDFPKTIATFLQTNRHYHINTIVLISQHPKRIPNRPRDISEIFWRIKSFKKLPLLPIGHLKATQYYQFEDYGKSDKLPKDVATYDFNIVSKWCFIKDLYNRYRSDYFYPMIEDKPLISHREYNDFKLSKKQILKNFYNIDIR
jgi:hypothetical protein